MVFNFVQMPDCEPVGKEEMANYSIPLSYTKPLLQCSSYKRIPSYHCVHGLTVLPGLKYWSVASTVFSLDTVCF